MTSLEKFDKPRLVSYVRGSGLQSPRKHPSKALASNSYRKCLGASPCLADLCNGDGCEAPVYLELFSNQKIGNQKVNQPRVSKTYPLSGGEPFIKAEWEYEEFVWLSEFFDRLPGEYLLLLELLDVNEEDYSLDLQGFYCYRHRYEKNRECDIDHIFIPAIEVGKYHPYASVKHRRRASSQALDRLEFLEEECRRRRVKFDYLVKVDLTIPKQISELWDSEKTQLNISRAVRDFFDLLHGKLFKSKKTWFEEVTGVRLHKGHNSRFGAIANHHYWATQSPLEPHRHIHLTIPNVTYNKQTDMFHRFRPFIKESVIKKCWRDALKKNGLWIEVPDHVKPDCYVGYIKFEDRARVLHRLSYCCRKPIEDLVRNLSSEDLVNFDEGFARFLLDYTPRRINLGFLVNLKRFGYSHNRIPLKCPVCGGDMYPERDKFGHAKLYDRPPPDIPRLFQERTGEWRRFTNRG